MARLFCFWVVAALFLAACSENEKDCNLAENKTTEVTVDYGKALVLEPKLCGVAKPQEVSYSWAQANQVVSTAPQYRFLACPRYKSQTTPVRVDLGYGSAKGHRTWNVSVRDIEPQYPSCSATLTPKEAMAVLQRGDLYGDKDGIDFKTAVSCIDRALIDYPCDIDLAFWGAYGDLMVFMQHLATSLAVSGISERSLNALVDERIDPLIARFDLLAAEMPNDFLARPKDFDFSILTLAIHPGGEWDRGDMLALDGAFHLAKGGAKFAAAYVDSLQAAQLLLASGLRASSPASIANISPAVQEKLVSLLDKDPAFLSLYPKEGEERLLAAQKSLIVGLRRLNEAITFVKAETDDQRDDMFRYFDCGTDAVCPPEDSRDPVRGDAGERLVKDEGTVGVYDPSTDVFIDANSNGRYDPAWIKVRADQGEGDLQYNDGETIGTDAFAGLIGRIGVPISAQIQSFLVALAGNIEGPDALDLTEFMQIPQDRLWQLTLVGGINVPSLRLSRWFEGPRSLRDFLPLWSHSEKRFFIDSEEEPYDDWGLDGVPNSQESVTGPTVTCDPGYFTSAADPFGDNFDPQRNPADRCDNDQDGAIDNVDPAGGRSRDYGTEGNAKFDFRDTNSNGKHDPGELSEPYQDVGLFTFGKAAYPSPNGKWDAIDMDHYWPKGADVGGREVTIQKDPRNGTLQDGLTPLIDPVYYFFPDAQFNGVLIFETPTVNAGGVPLTDNAELMRFISKFVATSRQLAD